MSWKIYALVFCLSVSCYAGPVENVETQPQVPQAQEETAAPAAVQESVQTVNVPKVGFFGAKLKKKKNLKVEEIKDIFFFLFYFVMSTCFRGTYFFYLFLDRKNYRATLSG